MDLQASPPADASRIGSPTMSNASSATSSPIKSPLELTPRSKIKHMLAALKDSSEDEAPAPRNHVPVNIPESVHAAVDDEEDSDVPQARRGTLAARLRQSRADAPSSNEGSDTNAYSRVKRRLAHAEAKPRSPKAIERSGTPMFAPHTSSDHAPSRAGVARGPSPGLFVSPTKSHAGEHPDEFDDLASKAQPYIPDRLKALIERRRRERGDDFADVSGNESIPVLDANKVADRPLFHAESEDDEEGEASKKFTQQARPTRKASKKAIEEMHRETQRMSRNMQLTHEARTKTRFSTADLFARFNFRQAKPIPVLEEQQPQQAPSSSATQSSDTEGRLGHDSPPSSPPSSGNDKHTSMTLNVQRTRPIGAAAEISRPSHPRAPSPPAEPTRTRRFQKMAVRPRAVSEDDDGLKIIKPRKASRLAVFDNIPQSKARESNSLHTLRALAHLNGSEKKSGRKSQKSMTPSELQALLQDRARKQAVQEREEKIQRLRERGVIVQSAEEKEKEQLQLESMLERARKEAEEIAQREKEAAKKEGKEENDVLDDDDDDEYQASDEDDVDELSGSEDEEENAHAAAVDANDEDEAEPEAGDSDGEQGSEDDELAIRAKNAFVDAEASDAGDDAESDSVEKSNEEMEDGPVNALLLPRQRPARRKIVDSDDEEDPLQQQVQSLQQSIGVPFTPTQKRAIEAPNSSTSDAFGFSNQKAVLGLGLSQVFAGTMAEDPTQMDESPANANQDSLAFLRNLNAPEPFNFDDVLAADSPQTVVGDSQTKETPLRPNGGRFDTQSPYPSYQTPATQLPEPTQDDGFQVGDSQLQVPQDPQSTVDTVLINQASAPEPQLPKTKSRLVQRRTRASSIGSAHGENDEPEAGQDTHATVDIFEHMRQKRNDDASKKSFDRKRSEAKAMFEEQAEESEDEYAGLGGASDDESQGDVDEETKRMIDDQSNEKTDERDIAAYYADKERRDDEKGIEKLYKDVINGGLRRKRGADHDLWDSDDEDEAAARRRAAKQREFAKMRKALLADEKIGKIAENPKQAAFLQAIEDRDDNDDFFLDRPEESFTTAMLDSQQSDAPALPLKTIAANNAGLNRTQAETDDSQVSSEDAENMPPPQHPRRAKVANVTRPTSLADIRNTLSELIDEPDSILESQRLSQDTEEDASMDENLDYRATSSLPSPPPDRNPRRTTPNARRTSVINRIALKKQSSSLGRTLEANQTRLAFQTSTNASFTAKVPSLLRRATTNNTSTGSMSIDTAPASAAAGGLGGKDTIKRGGSAKSSVNYYVREMERKAKLEKIETERAEGRLRVGKMRREVLAGGNGARGVGLGGLVGGSFSQ